MRIEGDRNLEISRWSDYRRINVDRYGMVKDKDENEDRYDKTLYV